ncbi:hypothetical protein ACO0QE_004581 [Hanseniaspora vineae]
MEDIICGSAAGALGKLIEYPFDTVKVRLQTSSHDMFPDTLSVIKYTVQKEGLITGFYKGVGSPLVGAMMENAVLFVSYNQTYKMLDQNAPSLNELSKIVLSGGAAGSCASFVLTPVELVKCKLQVSNIQNPNNTNTILSTIKDVVKSYGLKGLWKGQSSTFYRECIGGCMWFTTYEVLKTHLASTTEDKKPKTWHSLFSGAMAGIAFNASTFPIDTVKSLVQIDHHMTITRAIKETYAKQRGIQGFYRGLGITLVRAAPANAVVFYAYETFSSMFFSKNLPPTV